MSGYRKDDYSRRYDSEELPEDVIQASAALENLQLDRKARNLTSSWRFVSHTCFYEILPLCTS
jgi:FGFR1 oncogene partner